MVEKIPLNDPSDGITQMDKAVFGHDCKRHLVLGFLIQQGYQAPSVAWQVESYLRAVAQDHGKVVADHLRAKLKAPGAV